MDKAPRFLVDALGKHRDIRRSDHSVFHDFRISGNGCKRRLQLVGNICGKFFPHVGDRFLLFILFIHRFKKRGQLVIGLIFQRMFQIQLIDRFHEPVCLPFRHKVSEDHHNNRKPRHNGQVVERRPDQAIHGFRRAEHRPVIEEQCIVIQFLPHRIGHPDILPLAGGKGFLHLFPATVIFQRALIPPCIIKDFPLRADLRHAGRPVHAVHFRQIIRAGYINGRLNIAGLLPDFRLQQGYISVICDDRYDRVRKKQGDSQHHHHASLDLLSHAVPPTLYPTPRTVWMISPLSPSFCLSVRIWTSTVLVSPSKS